MTNPKKASSKDYLTFAEKLMAGDPDVSTGVLFGMPCLKVGKKSFAGSYDGGLVVKLTEAEAAEALRIDGATGFDPSGRGKPMKGWVVVPASAKKRWRALASLARQAL